MRKVAAVALSLLFALALAAQTYQPKFPGDKAKSNAEAAAIGYVRTVLTAENLYKKKHGTYAPQLASLVGSGSFTKRMASPDRGDYKVSYRTTKNGFVLALTPKQFDAEHRAFYTDENGKIRVEETKVATAASELL